MNDFAPLILGHRLVHKLSMLNGVSFYMTAPDTETREQDEAWWRDTINAPTAMTLFQNVISGQQWLNMHHVVCIDNMFTAKERHAVEAAMNAAGGFAAPQPRLIMPAQVDHARRRRL